jgi:hypothetical protein
VIERIAENVRRELGRFGPAAGMADLVSAWSDAVGEQIARNAWPARIARDGTLHVATSSSAWAFELAQLEATLRERLTAALGDASPPRLRFAPGRLPELSVEPSRRSKPPPPAPSAEARAEAERLAAGITDTELRKLVAKAASLSLARAVSDRPV